MFRILITARILFSARLRWSLLFLFFVSWTIPSSAAILNAIEEFEATGDVSALAVDLQNSFAEYTRCSFAMEAGCFKAVLDPISVDTLENARIYVETARLGPIHRIQPFNDYEVAAQFEIRLATAQEIERFPELRQFQPEGVSVIEFPFILRTGPPLKEDSVDIVEVEFRDLASRTFEEFAGTTPIIFDVERITATVEGQQVVVKNANVLPGRVITFGTVPVETTQVVPGPVNWNADRTVGKPVGGAVISFNPDSRQISVKGVTSSLTSPVTSIGLYGPATARKVGDPIFLFDNPRLAQLIKEANGDFNFADYFGPKDLILSREQARWFSADMTYVQLNTGGNPNGEIRGQVNYMGMGPVLDCNGDGQVNAIDFTCSNAAGTTGQLQTTLNLLPGDLDGTGGVGFLDFLIVAANFGEAIGQYNLGDIDGTGDVGFTDFLVVAANFGLSGPPNAFVIDPPNFFVIAPEPTSLVLLGLGWILLGLVRQRSAHCNS